ncbi:hypothetical protein CGRA01v4_06436 [Colletotrichum graminicola]|uniref:Uncharacterized protein n=1 Tax=Colletotrichum graminicola (strain M1.001 / M2 / FGSC 10212) TaxID=645133 RepID=E3Q2B8_COLGM|nr:uncharacterized protein GLRG_00363 [Colletotrichum graminicola M1.001]EFQ25219.1 hypothetical protein GLRG_00363 [Colletotrichum graminicola M1.001]WDK15155.1 hypothetical protein CGRA01v4_06436 [Colletotrichum graminicola]
MSFIIDEKPQTHLEVDPYDHDVMSGDSDSEVPPAYDDAFSKAPSTVQLQIHAVGYDYGQALTGNTLENIAVDRVETGELAYTSVRLSRSSNSCALVRGHDTSRSLISTIYRWGPGRPPRMRVFAGPAGVSVDDAIHNDHLPCELVNVKSRNVFSRTQRFATSFGTFEWRYADRAERKQPENNADSLLVCERTDGGGTGSSGGKAGKRGVQVAQLVRNEAMRTPGTTRWMGGNGGRLALDLSGWADAAAADGKGATAAQGVEAFLVASCICMLKREADRFKDNAIASVV